MAKRKPTRRKPPRKPRPRRSPHDGKPTPKARAILQKAPDEALHMPVKDLMKQYGKGLRLSAAAWSALRAEERRNRNGGANDSFSLSIENAKLVKRTADRLGGLPVLKEYVSFLETVQS